MKGYTENLVGQRFGKLLILELLPERNRNNKVWLCQCDCGNTTSVISTYLTRGVTQSCGCLRKKTLKPKETKIKIGQRFGKLVILEKLSEKRGNLLLWLCQCDCGSKTKAISSSLIRGVTKDCGCQRSIRLQGNEYAGKNLLGQRFGKLVVIDKTNEKTQKGITWKCQCDCGKYINLTTAQLNLGYKISCGCVPKKTRCIDLTGLQFGKLTVLERADNKQYKNGTIEVRWKCICECGSVVNISGHSLRRGDSRSCGCATKEFSIESRKLKVLSTEYCTNYLYKIYQDNAKAKNLEFTLPKEEFIKLVSSNCFYCGIEPKQILKVSRKTTDLLYNGIDRVDNSKGYTLVNSVSCCVQCNKAKLAYNIENFRNWIERVYNHLFIENNETNQLHSI